MDYNPEENGTQPITWKMSVRVSESQVNSRLNMVTSVAGYKHCKAFNPNYHISNVESCWESAAPVDDNSHWNCGCSGTDAKGSNLLLAKLKEKFLLALIGPGLDPKTVFTKFLKAELSISPVVLLLQPWRVVKGPILLIYIFSTHALDSFTHLQVGMSHTLENTALRIRYDSLTSFKFRINILCAWLAQLVMWAAHSTCPGNLCLHSPTLSILCICSAILATCALSRKAW